MNTPLKDILAQIIAREQQRYKIINQNIELMSAEEGALIANNRIHNFLILHEKKDKLVHKALEIHCFICKLDAIAHGASVDRTYDSFTDKDDKPITDLQKEAV